MKGFELQHERVDDSPGDEALPPLFVQAGRTLSREGRLGDGLWQSADDRALEARLIALIDQAAEIVCVCSYLLALPPLDEALRRASSRGVRVYVLTASEGRLDTQLRDGDDFGEKVRREHKDLLDRLAGRVMVRSAEHFHAKFVLTDPRTSPRGMLFTCNLTREAIRRNPELAVEMSGDAVAEAFAWFCHAFWEQAAHGLLEPGRLHAVQPAGRITAPETARSLFVTANGETSLKAAVLDHIRAARSRLMIACFGWDHPDVATAIRDRLAAGVDVTLLVRPRPAVVDRLCDFDKAGATIVGLPFLHAKALWSPESGGLLMTANLSRYGLDEGFEMGIAVQGRQGHLLERVLATWAEHGQPFHGEARVREILGEVMIYAGSPSPLEVVEEQVFDYGRIEATTAGALDKARPRRLGKPGRTKVHRVVHRWTACAPRLPAKSERVEAEELKNKGGKGKGKGKNAAAEVAETKEQTPTPFPIYKEPGSKGARVVAVRDPRRIAEAEAFAKEVGAARVVVEG